jgi:uncharacterized protein YbjT (DUF2867 family)
MSTADPRPRLLLVGGGTGLVGRAVVREFGADYQIRSLHRSASPAESQAGVDWWPADIATYTEWDRALADVDVVLNVAWYRWGKSKLFAGLHAGLERMLDAARRSNIRRFLHISVPDAPAELEDTLPYLTYKRQFDRALGESGLSYAILRPTMLFGPGDRLLSVMLRLMHRYPVFPMFGSGHYHVSPIAVPDLARALHLAAARDARGTQDLGGPQRYEYRVLTDRMFQALHKRPRYWSFSDRGSVRLARLVQSLGSSLLYAYEVDWLLSDRLGLPPYEQLDRPLARVESFLDQEAENLRGGRPRVDITRFASY